MIADNINQERFSPRQLVAQWSDFIRGLCVSWQFLEHLPLSRYVVGAISVRSKERGEGRAEGTFVNARPPYNTGVSTAADIVHG